MQRLNLQKLLGLFAGWKQRRVGPAGLAGLVLLSSLSLATGASAAPTKRYTVVTRGDFVLFGNTLAQDCGAGVVAPAAGSTVGACGLNTADSAPDVFWQADAPQDGEASANATVTAAMARSTAVLKLPQGASVLRAQLYWSGRQMDATDTSVTFERPGTFTQNVTASDTTTQDVTGVIYQHSADVTSLVQQHGPGAYRLSGADSINLPNLNNSTVSLGWYVAVIYRLDSLPPRSLSLWDGLSLVIDGAPADLTLDGFRVPTGRLNGKLGVVALEGDDGSSGDSLLVGGIAIDNGLNTIDNFFNSTRSTLGVADIDAGDLPRLSGAARSMSGLDIDVVDISGRLTAQATSLTVSATTSGDAYLLGVLVTAIDTDRPDLGGLVKSVRNLSRSTGSYHPGDEIEYTLTLGNRGTDTAAEVRLSDVLPTTLSYVAGSIEVTAGQNPGQKTDAMDADQATYDSDTRTLTIYVGQGATGTVGGTIMRDDAATVVRFRARIGSDVLGDVSNQAMAHTKSAYEVSLGGMTVDAFRSGNGTAEAMPTVINVTALPVAGTAPDLALSFVGALNTEGLSLRYTATVKNGGSGAAARLKLTYTLPVGVKLSDIVTGSGWTCTQDATQLLCENGQSLAAGATSDSVAFSVTPQSGQRTLLGEASVQALNDAGQPVDEANTSDNKVSTTSEGFSTASLFGGGFSCSQAGIGQAVSGSSAALSALLTLGLLVMLRRRRTAPLRG